MRGGTTRRTTLWVETVEGRKQTLGEALVELRRAGAALRELGVSRRAEQIHDVGLAWARVDREPVSNWLEAAVEASGYSAPMLRWGCRETFGRWTRSELYCLVGDELGRAEAVDEAERPQVVLVVLASTVPPAGLQSVVLALLAGCAVIVRPARRLHGLVAAFSSSLAQLSPTLAAAVRLVEVEPGDVAGMSQLADRVDAIVVHGSDDAVGAWRALAPTGQLVGYGQRISAAFVGRELAADQVEAVLEGLALDVCAWDQSGCLSPHVLYVERGGVLSGRARAERLVDEALPPVERRLPVGPASLAERARRESWVRARLLEADCLVSPGRTQVLVYDRPGDLEPGPGARVLVVRPVDDLDALVGHLSAVSPRLQALAVTGVGDRDALVERLQPAGLNYVCAPGHMQRPPLRWRHDGIGSIAPLVAPRG